MQTSSLTSGTSIFDDQLSIGSSVLSEWQLNSNIGEILYGKNNAVGKTSQNLKQASEVGNEKSSMNSVIGNMTSQSGSSRDTQSLLGDFTL